MLGSAIQNGIRPSQLITWTRADEDETPEDLTGATITGVISRNRGTNDALTGAFVVTDGASGVFRWDYSEADVATSGRHDVQFTATFGDLPTPAKTRVAKWDVLPSLTVA